MIFMSVLACATLAGPATTKLDDYFEVNKLADGVYGVIRKEPAGFAVDCNVVFIVNDKDVVMVDTNIGPESAGATLRALRKITQKPIRYVIGTHYHDDHIAGNTEVRKAFPNVEFIAHANSEKSLEVFGKPSRQQMIQGSGQMAAFLKDLLDKKKGFSGSEITEEERTSFLSDIRIAERYGREIPKMEIIPPSITVTDRLTLHPGSRTIEILALGSGHTNSDVVVHLPKERIAITGDLVVWPVPLVGNPQSHIAEWPAALEKVLALKPVMIVPGHGPVLRDDTYVQILIRAFRGVTDQVNAAVKEGKSLEEIKKLVKFDEFRDKVVGESAVRRNLFAMYFRDPVIAAAYREATVRK